MERNHNTGNGLMTQGKLLRKRVKHALYNTGTALILIGIMFLVLVCPKLRETQKNIILTFAIVDEMHDNNLTVNSSNLYYLIKKIPSIVKSKFPNGEFTYIDLLAIGYIETGYNFSSVGKLGEVGCFQILKPQEELADMHMRGKDVFDVEINCMMACNLLKKKYMSCGGDYKRSIVAYNGASIYYDKFMKVRNIMEKAVSKLAYNHTL